MYIGIYKTRRKIVNIVNAVSLFIYFSFFNIILMEMKILLYIHLLEVK